MAAAPESSIAAPSRQTPWDILDLQKPNSNRDLAVADVRHAFRRMVTHKHPDVGGTQEEFELLMWAYHEVVTRGVEAGTSTLHLTLEKVEDDFLSAFRIAARVVIPGYGSLANVEAETDDDGWMDREALSDFYVSRHDGLDPIACAAKPNDLAIYRLLHPIGGRSWGVGQIMCLQDAMDGQRRSAPGGLISIYAMRLAHGRLETGSDIHILADDCADIQHCKVVDRLELLREGVKQTEEGYVIEAGSLSHARLVSGRVHIAQCEYDEECDMKAEECVYCYAGDECYVPP